MNYSGYGWTGKKRLAVDENPFEDWTLTLLTIVINFSTGDSRLCWVTPLAFVRFDAGTQASGERRREKRFAFEVDMTVCWRFFRCGDPDPKWSVEGCAARVFLVLYVLIADGCRKLDDFMCRHWFEQMRYRPSILWLHKIVAQSIGLEVIIGCDNILGILGSCEKFVESDKLVFVYQFLDKQYLSLAWSWKTLNPRGCNILYTL